MTLRQIREDRFLTQTEVAAFVGVNSSTVSNWERGLQEPRIPQIRKLAEIFKLTPQEIRTAISETMANKEN
jgi:transcriptional regulator with XRE-family HTH domain